MTDVIEFLYESQCNEEPESIPELAELYEKESEIFDKIHAAQSQISHILELDCFRKGFLLGASLMLELL